MAKTDNDLDIYYDAGNLIFMGRKLRSKKLLITKFTGIEISLYQY